MIQFAPEPGSPQAFDAFAFSLLQADWKSSTGPMRFSPGLTLADLAHAPFFQDARVLLSALAEGQGTPATATGNLTRLFVASLLDRLSLSKTNLESIRRVCKVINEQDVWSLHLARVVAECAGVVARRNKRFQLTRAGRELLPDDQAGALYRRLFVAYFRKFDLRYDFHLRDVPFIQRTMAVVLWRLDAVVRDWTPVRGLARQILMRQVFEQLHAAMVSAHDTEEWILGGYVLEPLLDFGLLERKRPSEWRLVTEEDEVRITPLWRKFICFEPWAGATP